MRERFLGLNHASVIPWRAQTTSFSPSSQRQGMGTRKSYVINLLEWSSTGSSNEQRSLALVARNSHLKWTFPNCNKESIGLDKCWVFSLTKILWLQKRHKMALVLAPWRRAFLSGKGSFCVVHRTVGTTGIAVTRDGPAGALSGLSSAMQHSHSICIWRPHSEQKEGPGDLGAATEEVTTWARLRHTLINHLAL